MNFRRDGQVNKVIPKEQKVVFLQAIYLLSCNCKQIMPSELISNLSANKINPNLNLTNPRAKIFRLICLKNDDQGKVTD